MEVLDEQEERSDGDGDDDLEAESDEDKDAYGHADIWGNRRSVNADAEVCGVPRGNAPQRDKRRRAKEPAAPTAATVMSRAKLKTRMGKRSTCGWSA